MPHGAFGPLNPALILLAFVASLGVAASKGPGAALRWVYIPAFVLFPRDLELVFQGLPDLTVRRVATIGLIMGVLVVGSGRRLVPRWCWFDLLPVAATISFSISVGVLSNFRGFYTQLLELTVDWSLPYLIARALLRDRDAIRGALMSLALCTSVLAAQAIIEFVFDVRFDRLWNRLGAGIRSRPRWFRFGLRRTFVHFSTPVSLGAHFATVAPLIVLWRLIDRRRRRLANLALMFCVAGCIAAGSRGPWLALGAVALFFPLLARNPRLVLTSFAVLILLLSPIVINELNDRIQYTQDQLDESGNVDSGHYRIALWLIYGDQIGEAGWFGNPALVGAEYAAAWSIDNSYLYLLLTGGWLGGGLFIWMVLVRLSAGTRTISRLRTGRNAFTATIASFTACILCMLNTWFNPCFAHLFWLTGALAINHARIASKDDRGAGDSRRRRARRGRPARSPLASHQG